MRTMSLYESGESTGAVSLKALFDGNLDIGGLVDFDIDDIAFALCRGGWPQAVTETDPAVAPAQAKNYVNEMLDSDIDELEGAKRNSIWLRSIMRAYARNISSEAPVTTIAADMQGERPSIVTVTDYIDALKRAFVTEDLNA